MDIDLELGRANGSAAATRRPEQPRIPENNSAKRPGGRDVSRSSLKFRQNDDG